jgi:hypothetical protein
MRQPNAVVSASRSLLLKVKGEYCTMIHDTRLTVHRCIYYITCGILPYIKLYIKGSKVLSDEDGEEDIVVEALSLCLTAIYKGI